MLTPEILDAIEAIDEMPLNDLTRLRMDIKDQMSLLNQEEKTYKEAVKKIEEAGLRHLEAIGLETAKTEYAHIAKQEKSFPSVVDWQALVEYIKENDAWHLFQKRLSSTAFNEICEITGSVPPGVEIYETTTSKFVDNRNKRKT